MLRPKWQARCLSVRVGKESLKRALPLLASLISIAEHHDAKIVISQGERDWHTSLVAFGQSIQFSISETAHQRVLDPPPVERTGHYVRVLTFRGKPIEYIPTGKMTLTIEFYGARLRTSWTEGKHNLDELLPEIVCCLFKAASLRRRDRLNQAAEADAKARREIELKQLRHRIEEEERRVKDLESAADNWTKAKQIREYVLVVIETKKAAGEELGPDTPFGIWTVWALQQADRLDPLVKSPPSILDRKKELPREVVPQWGR